MKLTKVQIHNFRGILDQQVVLRDYTLLVGANNSGKTSVLDAIRVFYEDGGLKFQDSRDFPYKGAKDDESWIELTFALTDVEWSSLADQYKEPGPDHMLSVRKWLKKEGKAAGQIFGYRYDGSLSEEPFYGAKNVQSGKFGHVIYVPAISTVDDSAKLTGPSPMRELLTSILVDVVEHGKAYGDFAEAIRGFSSTVVSESAEDGRSLSEFEQKLNGMISSWQVQFHLEFSLPSAQDLIKSLLEWNVADPVLGRSQKMDSFGSGFQRYFIYSLVRVASEYAGKRPEKETKDFTPSLNLLLFEEPEAFLHPPMQQDLSAKLRGLADAEDWQVVCATHSAHFVSKSTEDIPSLVRLRRSDGVVHAFQIGREEWQQIVNSNHEMNRIAGEYPSMSKDLSQDDPSEGMEALKYFIWLNADRSSAFFADHVLLVEGPTEVALINKLVADRKISNVPPGFYVMDCMGKYNIPRFVGLFKALGIPHSVLYDDDGNRNQHSEVNALIDGMRDADLTIAVKPVPGCLEKTLGVPDGPRHSKPEHMLGLYERGEIDEQKLLGFCALVGECMPLAKTAGQSSSAPLDQGDTTETASAICQENPTPGKWRDRVGGGLAGRCPG